YLCLCLLLFSLLPLRPLLFLLPYTTLFRSVRRSTSACTLYFNKRIEYASSQTPKNCPLDDANMVICQHYRCIRIFINFPLLLKMTYEKSSFFYKAALFLYKSNYMTSTESSNASFLSKKKEKDRQEHKLFIVFSENY